MYQTNSLILGRALGAGLAAAILIGVAWGFLNQAGLGRGSTTWDFWFSLVIGFGIAESVSWAAKRRRGSNLQIMAIGLVLLGFIVSRVIIVLRATQLLDGDVIAAVLQDTITQPSMLAFLALACLIAWRRFR